MEYFLPHTVHGGCQSHSLVIWLRVILRLLTLQQMMLLPLLMQMMVIMLIIMMTVVRQSQYDNISFGIKVEIKSFSLFCHRYNPYHRPNQWRSHYRGRGCPDTPKIQVLGVRHPKKS